jgi:hypothetical protein
VRFTAAATCELEDVLLHVELLVDCLHRAVARTAKKKAASRASPEVRAPRPAAILAWDGGGLRVFGAMVAAAGVAGEAVADMQLARFKREPEHVGRVCDVGLWRYTRHPTYFFEWCFWLGLAVYGLWRSRRPD